MGLPQTPAPEPPNSGVGVSPAIRRPALEISTAGGTPGAAGETPAPLLRPSGSGAQSALWEASASSWPLNLVSAPRPPDPMELVLVMPGYIIGTSSFLCNSGRREVRFRKQTTK